MVGWEQRSRPLSGARPTASLKRGSPRRASQSSASSYPQAIANMRKRSIAGSVWTTRSGSRHSRMQPASVSDRPSRRSARATGPARRRTRSTRPRNRRSPSCGLRLEDRTGEEHLRSWRAWRSRCLGRNALGNEFLPDLNGLRHVRHHIVAPQGIKRASDGILETPDAATSNDKGFAYRSTFATWSSSTKS